MTGIIKKTLRARSPYSLYNNATLFKESRSHGGDGFQN